MTRYLIRRALSLIPTIFIIITLAFIIVRLAPGGPFSGEKNLPPEIVERIKEKYHLDEPLPKQYLRYMGMILQGDLGPSTRFKDFTINDVLSRALPVSMLLGVLAISLSVSLGLSAGLVSALRQNSWVDYFVMSLAVIGISVPLFVIGPILKLYFSLKLQWLPTSGWLTDGWIVLIMPVATLALPNMAAIARLTRASLLEVLRADYIRTARAKGLSEPVILLKHAMKGALLPVVSFLGPAFAFTITGAVVVETIFTIPGLGRYYIQGAINRDYGLILGDVIVVSLIVVTVNFLVDVIYGFLDPRISYT